jgi:hypothetical protein
MSIKQYPGGIITKNPTAPTTTVAKGIWTLNQVSNYVKQGIWPRSPGAPTIGTATVSVLTASVPFTAPTDTGSASITGYTATSSPSGIQGTSATSPISVTGLAANTSYTFSVFATNGAGTGPSSGSSNSITTANVPGAPTIGTATATDATTATVAYTAPASDGGSTITTYTATSSPGGVTGTLSQAGSGTVTVSGLTGGTSYTFTVTATNAIGTGAASAASNSITTQLAIGQAYQGGYYAGQIGVSGTATHNLVVAPKSSGQSTLSWMTGTLSAVSGADSNINGPQNTADMVAAGSSTIFPAAYFCSDLVTGGYSDWYMPAKNELEVCYFFLKPTTNNNQTSSGSNANAVSPEPLNTTYTNSPKSPNRTSATIFQSGNAEAFDYSGSPGGVYWSSTESTSTKAWHQYFNPGTQSVYYGGKSQAFPVRAIRRVAV